MPTYEYQCDACGERFEKFQSITAPAIKKCPKCGKNKVRRLISAGAGILFKGSGFYITDYRDKSYTDKAKAESGATSSESKSGENKTGDNKAGDTKKDTKLATADAKPAATAETKPAAPAAASKSASKKHKK
jgi:putative FmdB family regulatory protein